MLTTETTNIIFIVELLLFYFGREAIGWQLPGLHIVGEDGGVVWLNAGLHAVGGEIIQMQI